jgi:hypothetical protein
MTPLALDDPTTLLALEDPTRLASRRDVDAGRTSTIGRLLEEAPVVVAGPPNSGLDSYYLALPMKERAAAICEKK